jgi:hypothetical protein
MGFVNLSGNESGVPGNRPSVVMRQFPYVDRAESPYIDG